MAYIVTWVFNDMIHTASHAPEHALQLKNVPDVALFTSPAPCISTSEAENVLHTFYGMQASAVTLNSERDANFLIRSGVNKFVLKFTNSKEPNSRTSCNTAALTFIAKQAPELPVPKIVETTEGHPQFKYVTETNSCCIVRLFSYIEGRTLSGSSHSSITLKSIGHYLGRLDCALADFQHPAMNYSMLWDSPNVARLRDLIDFIPDKNLTRMIDQFFLSFEENVKPKLKKLRSQMIHNDANLGNVLVDSESSKNICGILDFGDLIFAPVINELAVAASYHVRKDADLSSTLGAMISGYNQCYALHSQDLDILLELIEARFVNTLLVSHWRAALFPANRSYIYRNTAIARDGFDLFSDLDRGALLREIKLACGMEL